MSKSKPEDQAARREARKARRPEITPWKKILLGVAGLFVVVGGALRAFGGSGGGALSPSGSSGGATPNSLVGGDGGSQLPGSGGGTAQAEADPGASEWSPFFLKGGFSFFVAFCVGYAIRVWLKVSFLLLGTFFVGVFALSYLGAIQVEWATVEGWWNRLSGWVQEEGRDFQTFLTGSLPQAGLATLGLVTGFKRR